MRSSCWRRRRKGKRCWCSWCRWPAPRPSNWRRTLLAASRRVGKCRRWRGKKWKVWRRWKRRGLVAKHLRRHGD